MSRITLENIEFFAKIGHIPAEHQIGNKVMVDVSFDFDSTKAATSDELSDTVDYKAIYDTIKGEVDQRSKLIENMAARALGALVKAFPEASNWEFTLTKMHPPVNGRVEKVSITLKA